MEVFLVDWWAQCLLLTAQAAPFVLLGLAIAGVVHVVVPERTVLRWMGGSGLAAAARAAAIGVPLPVCSCGVLPLAIELDRKGASRPATASFLVTTPESSVDSILVTWGLMGPLMAVVRPLAAFATGMLAAALVMIRPSKRDGAGAAPDTPSVDQCCPGSCHSATKPPVPTAEGGWWRRWVEPSLGYGFGSLLDDIAGWLLAGLAAGGLLAVVLPDDLSAYGLGHGLAPMLVMVLVGVPLYTCASAATPVAAVMISKGLAPGAALVFLLAGPATSIATMVLLAGHFGRGFVVRYVAAVAMGALVAGTLFDALVDPRWIRAVTLAATAPEGLGAFDRICAVVLVGLALRSLVAALWRRAKSSAEARVVAH